MTFTYPKFAYRRSPDQDRRAHHDVVVIGAGPVGLTAAIDLARAGVGVVLIDDDDTVSVGSRGICYAKRTLEIWHRLGCVAPLMAKGVTWQRGKVYHRESEVYDFDLLPESGHRFPAFINLQQYYLEDALVRAAMAATGIDLRWRHRLTGIAARPDGATLAVETPEGHYAMDAKWVIACDGARSPTRKFMGLDFKGRVFEDRFLIADVKLKADFPPVRRFWFDPPFHAGQSALMHRQPDDVFRIDLQLGWDADPEVEKQPARVIPRIKQIVGDAPFELDWVSVYTFQCRRLENFRHGRVIFAGDAAHQVSPFGARGANSGIQDVDNLVWKLKLVLDHAAPEALLDSYDAERVAASDENLLNSTRSTDFIAPKGPAAKLFRDAALTLARDHAFARRLVNSGRLSVPKFYDTGLSTPDADRFAGRMTPGAPAADAPLSDGFLIDKLGDRFVLMIAGTAPALPAGIAALSVPATGPLAERYDLKAGTCYLIRPDQHVAARWRKFSLPAIQSARARATGHP